MYINNLLKADDFGFFEPSYGTPQNFSWQSGETWGTGWVDCVNIFAGSVGIDNELSNLVKTISFNSINTQIDISNLPSGMYLLNLMDKNGNLLKSEKIIKE